MRRRVAATVLAFLLLVVAPSLAQAGIGVTLLTETSRNGPTITTITSASVTPTANALNLCLVWSAQTSGTIAAPTVTGNGLTWDLVATTPQPGTTRAFLFRSMGASPSAGTIVATYGANQDDILLLCTSATGVDTSGSNGSGAVGQSKPDNVSTNNLTLTFDAPFAAADNRPVMFAARADNSSATTSEWTEVFDGAHSNVGTTVVMWKNASDDTSGTMTWGTTSTTAAILVEVKAPPGCEGRLALIGVGC
jgi:hypothetical protein